MNYVIFYKYNLQLCHHVTRAIMPQANCAIMSLMICVVSAIMSRAKYALNTRYARKQNLKLYTYGAFSFSTFAGPLFWSLFSAVKLSFAGPLFLVIIFWPQSRRN